jgi:hypothetical protein
MVGTSAALVFEVQLKRKTNFYLVFYPFCSNFAADFEISAAFLLDIGKKDECIQQEEKMALPARTRAYRDGQNHYVLGE